MSNTINLKTGDIIGFSPWNLLGVTINLFTFGIPLIHLAHVGVVWKVNNKTLLLESTTVSETQCHINGDHVDGVQAPLLKDKLNSHYGYAYHIPLVNSLTKDQEYNFHDFALQALIKKYDYRGAARSATFVLSKLKHENLDTLFCSELVLASYESIGLISLSNVGSYSPNKMYRYLKNQKLIKGKNVINKTDQLFDEETSYS